MSNNVLDYHYCPYCGKKIEFEEEKKQEYYCGIDNDYCWGETCTSNFIEKCMYLKWR